MSSQKNRRYRVPDDTGSSSHLHQAGTSSPVSTVHSSKNGPSNGASHGPLMDNATVAYDAPSGITDRVYVTITGPTPLGEAAGFQSQVYLVSEGNVACTPAMDGTKWRVHRQGDPNRHPILADDQRFNSRARLESVATSKAFSIHKAFEFYLNEDFSLYRNDRSKNSLEFTVDVIEGEVKAILADIPESVVLIRCDFPFYDSVNPESRVVIEHIVVEYFRSPWLLDWKRRVRSALVQKPRPWFKSVTGEEDEVFPCVAQSLDVSISPLVADQMPAANVSPSALDDSMDIDTQPFSTAAGSANTASLQDNAVACPICTLPLPDACQYLDQVCLCINPADLTLEPTPGSDSEVTDITDALDDDGDPDSESMETVTEEVDDFITDYTVSSPQESAVDDPTTWPEAGSGDNPLPHVDQEHHNNNNNNNTEGPQQPAPIPETASITVTNPRPDGLFYCSFENCPKTFTRQGNLDAHFTGCHIPGGRERCTFFPCIDTFSQPSVRKRHENFTHKGYMYVCDNCGARSTRKPSPRTLNAMAPCRPSGLHNFLLYIPES